MVATITGRVSIWKRVRCRFGTHGASPLEERPTLASNGFEMLTRPLVNPDLDFLNHDQVVLSYYPDCAEIVREASGAAFTAAFDHNVRSAAGKNSRHRIRGGQHVQGPARVVHGDYTLTSAPQRLRDLTRPPTVTIQCARC